MLQHGKRYRANYFSINEWYIAETQETAILNESEWLGEESAEDHFFCRRAQSWGRGIWTILVRVDLEVSSVAVITPVHVWFAAVTMEYVSTMCASVQHSHTQNVHAVAGSYGTGNSWFSNFVDLASTSQEHCNKKGYVQFIPSLGHNWSVASPLQLWTIRNYVFLVLQKKNCHLNEHSNVIYVLQKLELCSILEAFLELVKQINCSLNDVLWLRKRLGISPDCSALSSSSYAFRSKKQSKASFPYTALCSNCFIMPLQNSSRWIVYLPA